MQWSKRAPPDIIYKLCMIDRLEQATQSTRGQAELLQPYEGECTVTVGYKTNVSAQSKQLIHFILRCTDYSMKINLSETIKFNKVSWRMWLIWRWLYMWFRSKNWNMGRDYHLLTCNLGCFVTKHLELIWIYLDSRIAIWLPYWYSRTEEEGHKLPCSILNIHTAHRNIYYKKVVTLWFVCVTCLVSHIKINFKGIF
jgi:hypothetical protein